VGFSGGLDSTVLLHAVCAFARSAGLAPPLAVHVHHGLQAAADDWARDSGARATELGAIFMLHRVSVERRGGDSIEAAARHARLAAFARVDADAVLLGHHRDDQAETVLFNALRGSGIAGLAGMPVVRVGSGPPLLRPFLDVPRTSLHDYAAEYGLSWIDDPSNADIALRRNFLRHSVLPSIETGMPQARVALARLAGHAAEAAQLLDELAELDATTWTVEGELRCRAFVELPPHRARNLLRRVLALHALRMPDAARLEEMLRQLSGGGRPEIRHEGYIITRRQGRLIIEATSPEDRPAS